MTVRVKITTPIIRVNKIAKPASVGAQTGEENSRRYSSVEGKTTVTVPSESDAAG